LPHRMSVTAVARNAHPDKIRGVRPTSRGFPHHLRLLIQRVKRPHPESRKTTCLKAATWYAAVLSPAYGEGFLPREGPPEKQACKPAYSVPGQHRRLPKTK